MSDLPLLVERILGTPARLASLCAHVPVERLALHRQGSWCAMEHIGHLMHLDEHMLERMEDFAARRPTLCAIDLKAREGRLAGQCVRALGDVLEELRLGRHELVARISALDPGALRHRALHPCKGRPMTVSDQVFFIAEHDDHHLAVLRSLLQGRNALPAGAI